MHNIIILLYGLTVLERILYLTVTGYHTDLKLFVFVTVIVFQFTNLTNYTYLIHVHRIQ